MATLCMLEAMSKAGFKAQSAEDLHEKIRLYHMDVPPRKGGRKTYHVENWCMMNFLYNLIHMGYLKFLLEVSPKEMPDFVIKYIDYKIGIEITELIPKNIARYCSHKDIVHICIELYNESCDDKMFDKLLKYPECTSGWTGEEAKEKFLDMLASAINHKLNRLKKYTIYNKNWLLIYDNTALSLFADNNRDSYIYNSIYTKYINMICNREIKFDNIWIIYKSKIIEMDINGFRVHAFNNIMKP